MSDYKILVAVDFSNFCEQVLECTAKQLKCTGGKAVVVYAVPSYLEFASDSIPHEYLDKIIREQVSDGKDKMAGILPRYFPEGSYSTHIVQGYPTDAILQVARDEHVDMVIVGSHGHRGIEATLLGSVAEKIIRKSHVPVLVVRPNCDKK